MPSSVLRSTSSSSVAAQHPTADRDLELLVLRQELLILRRTAPRPRWWVADRLILAALGRKLSAVRCNYSFRRRATPATVRVRGSCHGSPTLMGSGVRSTPQLRFHAPTWTTRSEEHTSELQSLRHLV